MLDFKRWQKILWKLSDATVVRI